MIDARKRAVQKLLANGDDFESIQEDRQGGLVQIVRRSELGRVRILKQYFGALLPLQAVEFKLLSHRKLPPSFRHLVAYRQSTPMSRPEIVMRDCGLDLDDWQALLGFESGSPIHALTGLFAVWRGAANALSSLHAAGFVHCDVKADNFCMRTQTVDVSNVAGAISGTLDFSSITLIDFGLALQPVDGFDPRGCYVDNGQAVVTPHGDYMSPLYLEAIAEAQRLFVASRGRASGHPPWLTTLNGIDWRADIYSLAKMMQLQFDAWQNSNARTNSDVRQVQGLIDWLAEISADRDRKHPPPHGALLGRLDRMLDGNQPTVNFRASIRSKANSRSVSTTDRTLPRRTSMLYAIDGNNVLLNLLLDGKPSTRAFARMLMMLEERGHQFKLFFDNSITRWMNDKRVEEDWQRLEAAFRNLGVKPHFAARADFPIEEFCAVNGAALINAHDKCDSWTRKPKTIHRARVGRKRGQVQVELRDSTGRFVLSAAINEAFTFGGVNFPSLSTTVNLEVRLNRDEHAPTGVTEATLLVFALDGSQSMIEGKAFDGRRKSDHLNEIMTKTFSRLRSSKLGDSLYLAVLTFSDDVQPVDCPGTGDSGFSSAEAWHQSAESFNYLKDFVPGRTNIRLALQRSKELIQDALFESEVATEIADHWRACIVLVTDGNHYVLRADGNPESEQQVIDEVLDIDSGAAGLIGGRIDVACVGIGNDLKSSLLQRVASPCSPRQLAIARVNRVDGMLVGQSLFIKVDERDKRYEEAIRSFIDVASGTA